MGVLTVVVGLGVVGSAAIRQMLQRGLPPDDVAAVDVRPDAVEEAIALGVRGRVGNGMERAVLAPVVGEGTRCVVVAVGPDATAVLVTMLARDLCPGARVHTALREAEYVTHARRAGADEVVAGAEWTGRTLAFVVGPWSRRS
jgi:voltage-gated potassium channel